MNKKKYLVLTLLMVMSVIVGCENSNEEDKLPPMLSPEQYLEVLTVELDLTEDQQKEIMVVFMNHEIEMEELKNSDNPMDMMDLMMEINFEILKILDSEQKAAFNAMRESLDGDKQGRGGMGGPPGR